MDDAPSSEMCFGLESWSTHAHFYLNGIPHFGTYRARTAPEHLYNLGDFHSISHFAFGRTFSPESRRPRPVAVASFFFSSFVFVCRFPSVHFLCSAHFTRVYRISVRSEILGANRCRISRSTGDMATVATAAHQFVYLR